MSSADTTAARIPAPGGLTRQMGLVGLAATGICSMLGAGIHVVPFMLQRSVPGIGPWVLPTYLFAAVPAVLAAIAYAILASAMPRAGGSYVYASRSLSPYMGFVASFSQWFGLSIAIGVVSYLIIPFLRDIAAALGMAGAAGALDTGAIRVGLALALLWLFVGVNLLGIRLYERILVPMMIAMFVLGGIVIVAGFWFNQADFAAALLEREGRVLADPQAPPLTLSSFLAAAAVLFSSFIGFDAIAQAGGEARRPGRNLPIAIALAVGVVGSFYLLFSAAVYHAVPWSFIAQEAAVRDVTAPGLLGYLLSPGWTVAIVAGAAIALINDLPAMLLSVSRLMFAWAEDGIFPRALAKIHPRRRTPGAAILASGAMASVGIVGCQLAGDFFLGVDLLVTSMLVNFLLMAVSVLALPKVNPGLAQRVEVAKPRALQVPLMLACIVLLGTFLVVHVGKDLAASGVAWYLRSTTVWLIVMGLATVIYLRETRRLRRSGGDLDAIFAELPPE